MKKISFLFLSLVLAILLIGTVSASKPLAQKMIVLNNEDNYINLWNEVEKLDKKQLPKSALEQVNKIYLRAKEDQNQEQLIKTLFYKARYLQSLEEHSFVKTITLFKQEAQQADFPNRQIIYSIIGEQFFQYYQRNQWRINQRTTTQLFVEENIETWSLNQILEQSFKYLLLSLEREEALKGIALDNFKNIIQDGLDSDAKSTEKYRPLLFDFLAHRAIDIFSNNFHQTVLPANSFKIDQQDYFEIDENFVKNPITIADSTDTKNLILSLLQKLTQVHLNDKEKDALIDVELKRLKFLKNEAQIDSNIEEIYYQALEKLSQKYAAYPAVSDVFFEMAMHHFNKGQNYRAQKRVENKYENEKALKICYATAMQYANSLGAKKCLYLLDRLREKQLSFQNEKFYASNKKSKLLVDYKNIDKCYFKILKIDPKTLEEWTSQATNYEILRNKFEAQKPFKTWEQDFVKDLDYNRHSTEVLVEALPIGFYVIIASADKDFKSSKAYQYSTMFVSDIAYYTKKTKENEIQFFVSDRTTGQPLKDVKAEVFVRKYDYKKREYIIEKKANFLTNKNGQFQVNSADFNSKNNTQFYVEFKYGNDFLNNKDFRTTYTYRDQTKKSRIKTHFFTDRAIYRPGQVIYFKGIVIQNQGKSNEIKTNYATTVEFLDVHGQKLAKLAVTTNDYGSFSGSFVAPEGKLNGSMQLHEKNGTHRLRVEEYKRPKYEVKTKPISEGYKLNESLKIDGFAKTYSGAPIDNATVKYSVRREGSFPYWCWYRWGYLPSSPSVEISQGVSKTDEQGNFEIEFVALADQNIDSKFSATYNYTIHIDVVDINGEMQSTTRTVKIGEKALILSTNVQGSILKENLTEIEVNTSNLNEQFVGAQVAVEVWSLEAPKKYYKERKWQTPEKHIMSKAEFEKYFPLENYEEEHLVQHWEKKEKLLSKTINTHVQKSLKVDKSFNLKQGSYFIQLKAKDEYDNEVLEEKYFSIIDQNIKKADPSIFFEITDIKMTVEPGEQAKFLISTAADHLKVFFEIEKPNAKNQTQWLSLNKEQKVISIPVEESDRGNFFVHLTFVKDNQAYSYTKTVKVPYSNKELDIEFSTFRDKLMPGQEEEWILKIKGPKGEKITAEILASMYDASLDAFQSNSWYLDLWSKYASKLSWQTNTNFNTSHGRFVINKWNTFSKKPFVNYAKLNYFGLQNPNLYGNQLLYRADLEQAHMISNTAYKSQRAKEKTVVEESAGSPSVFSNNETEQINKLEKKVNAFEGIQIRNNFNETAFFEPHLYTDSLANVYIKFKIPESLTRWKFMTLAHTKDLKTGLQTRETISQKDLMVYPNAPRFFREKDSMVFSAKLINLSKENLKGQAQLTFYNARTNEEITQQILLEQKATDFSLSAEKSSVLNWNIVIPENVEIISYKVVAKAGNFSDGEEKPIPVLSNRILVTESLPLSIRGKETKTWTLEKLKNHGSSTLRNHKLSLEFSANPVWYAIQALPYLMENSYPCSEQIFSRFYANAIASHIANSKPKIKEIFQSWANQSPEAFLSNLDKNQELKSIVLEETPWVLQAKSESERKKRVSLLFDLNKMNIDLEKTLLKLQNIQNENGAWPWFQAMPDSRHITQHIVCGMGHLDKLNITSIRQEGRTWQMILDALSYLDNEIYKDYEALKKSHSDLAEDQIKNNQIQYLYMRSYFLDVPMKHPEAYQYYLEQANTYWNQKNQYMQAMIALALHRNNQSNDALNIISSLKEFSIENKEMGMYWKQKQGYYWYQAPIEKQALLIEAFSEISDDKKSVESMKVWLLKQKQTQDWKTTKATTEACYALLLQGNDWLTNESQVEIKIANEILDMDNKTMLKKQEGTGYFKTSWSSDKIKPEMATITIQKFNEGVSWGALYYQYFEDLEKITPAQSPLSLDKKLFVVRNSDKGEVIEPINEKMVLSLGDKVRVRVVLRCDRDLEYVHMKDMRASGFEPIDVFSGMRYQDGLSYYESTKDASTNFFISWLAKGTYVFEYDLKTNIKGNFSNGITSIQCMYSPEFSSHSEGTKIRIEY